MFAEELSLLRFADGAWQDCTLLPARPVEADVYQALVLSARVRLPGQERLPRRADRPFGRRGSSALTLAIAVMP